MPPQAVRFRAKTIPPLQWMSIPYDAYRVIATDHPTMADDGFQLFAAKKRPRPAEGPATAAKTPSRGAAAGDAAETPRKAPEVDSAARAHPATADAHASARPQAAASSKKPAVGSAPDAPPQHAKQMTGPGASKQKQQQTKKHRSAQPLPDDDDAPDHVSLADDVDEDDSSDGKAEAATDRMDTLTNFAALGLREWLVNSAAAMAITRPTPVQQACIPAILAGNTVFGCSPTGSGKTAAYVLPVLQKLSADPYGIFAIVLAPSRELVLQIGEQFQAFGAPMGIRIVTVVGGVDMQAQALQLERLPHIVIATPGRFLHHMTTGATRLRLNRVAVVVLDEADRLLDATLSPDVQKVLAGLPTARQTLVFSATLTSSLETLHAMCPGKPFKYFATVEATTVSQLQQYYMFIPSTVKASYLAHLVKTYGPENAVQKPSEAALTRAQSLIIFVGSCYNCQLLTELLTELEILAVSLHSKLSQARRIASLQKFKSGVVKILVATDVASRGLDIPSVEMVVNYDLPRTSDDYIHRVGRTARVGRRGRAVSLVTQHDVQLFLHIERSIGKKMEEYKEFTEDDVLPNMGKVGTALEVAKVRLVEQGFIARLEADRAKRRQQAEA